MLGIFWKPIHLPSEIKSIYDFKIKSINGGIIDLSQYKGKKILIVNTASHCGYTPQYKPLEELFQKNKDKLVVIGIPSNDFGLQEPGSSSEIEQFCTVNYGVTFPLAAKVKVTGSKKHPLYIWLTEKKHNHHSDSKVKWNFQKYLIDESGNLTHVFDPKINPMDQSILDAIKG